MILNITTRAPGFGKGTGMNDFTKVSLFLTQESRGCKGYSTKGFLFFVDPVIEAKKSKRE
jgi:hypothetical protein